MLFVAIKNATRCDEEADSIEMPLLLLQRIPAPPPPRTNILLTSLQTEGLSCKKQIDTTPSTSHSTTAPHKPPLIAQINIMPPRARSRQAVLSPRALVAKYFFFTHF
jgi:hypothetical protein